MKKPVFKTYKKKFCEENCFVRITADFSLSCISRSHGVMVSTLDSESSDPSSNLGETSNFLILRSKIVSEIWILLGFPYKHQAVIAQLGER